MATDDADAPDSAGPDEADEPDPSADGPEGEGPDATPAVAVGEYTWRDFLDEHGHEEALAELYPDEEAGKPAGDDWKDVEFNPLIPLGFHPDDLEDRIGRAVGDKAQFVHDQLQLRVDPGSLPVVKGRYSWEHFKHQYYYEDGEAPTSGGEVVPFEPEEYLGFAPHETDNRLAAAGEIGEALSAVVDERTVTTFSEFDEEDIERLDGVDPEGVTNFDEDAFFTDEEGRTTLTNRYDLEKTVPLAKKSHFREEQRYWVNEPYSFIVIFHSVKENEKKYYVVEPYLNQIEKDLKEFLTRKLRSAIKYSDDEVVVEGTEEDRRQVIERETRRLLERYGLHSGDDGPGMMTKAKALLGMDVADAVEDDPGLEGIEARPEPVVLEEDAETISEYQVEKLLYYLKRDFIGYERIDPIKHDTVNVEDISCNGYNAPVFVYHSDYEQIITNVYHGDDQLDDFVVKLAQRSGKGISKRRPQVDATLPDGSRSQLTLGDEVSDHGTNYTIRQFQEVPFTPIDQIAWNTMSLEEVAFLWLCIENHKSMIIAGGTATGKTTLLNAMSLFIPSSAKIVSIEDTREVELPQRNWIASVTRPSFGEDDKGDVDEFDLLEAALRQRPDYIVMGEVRGEEGRDLFQVMSTGHTSYSTFHADSVGEVLKRFTTDPINVSKTMFTALDLVAIQSRTRVEGHSVVRNKNLTEINHYDAENDEINVQDVYQWQAETDEFLKQGNSTTLETIMFDRGWGHDKLQEELFKRETILAYLIENGLNTYEEVAATFQAFMNDPETILALVANGQLERSLEDLREMESVLIDVDPEKEAMAPRPSPDETTAKLCEDILDRAEESLLGEYAGEAPANLVGTLEDDDEEELLDKPSEVVELPEEESEEVIEFTGEVSPSAIESGSFDIEEDAPALAKAAAAEAGGEEADAGATDEQPATTEAKAEADAAAEQGAGAEADAAAERGAGAEADADADDGGDGDEDGPGWLFGDDDDEDLFDFDDDGPGEDAGTDETDEEVEEIAIDDDVLGSDDGGSEEDPADETPEETADGGLAFGDVEEREEGGDDTTDGGDAGGAESESDDGGGLAFDAGESSSDAADEAEPLELDDGGETADAATGTAGADATGETTDAGEDGEPADAATEAEGEGGGLAFDAPGDGADDADGDDEGGEFTFGEGPSEADDVGEDGPDAGADEDEFAFGDGGTRLEGAAAGDDGDGEFAFGEGPEDESADDGSDGDAAGGDDAEFAFGDGATDGAEEDADNGGDEADGELAFDDGDEGGDDE